MKITRQWPGEALRIAAIAVVAAVVLPLVAVAAVFLRGVLAAVLAAVLIGGGMLLIVSPRFRGWLDDLTRLEVSYKGLRLATDVDLHPSHGWVRTQPGGLVVGADDLAQAALGPVDRVELPPVGRRVERGEPMASLVRDGRSLELRAPVSGTVAGANAALLAEPSLVNEAPFTRGWLVRFGAEGTRGERRRLIRGRRARSWFREEVDRLVSAVEGRETSLGRDALSPTLPDGGTLDAAALHRHIDDESWKTFTETFFGERPESVAAAGR